MREHFLSNKEAARLFLPNQQSGSAKTIRKWLNIYKEYGPLGFFKMEIDKIIKDIYDKKPEPIKREDLTGKSSKELLEIIYHLDLNRCVNYALYDALKKKVMKSQE